MISKKLKLKTISKILCNYYGISENDIFIKIRTREVVEKRQLFYYLARKFTLLTFSEIGAYSRKLMMDHSTVLYSYTRIGDIIEFDKQFRREVGEIEDKIKEHAKKLEGTSSNEIILNDMIKLFNKLTYDDDYKKDLHFEMAWFLGHETNKQKINMMVEN